MHWENGFLVECIPFLSFDRLYAVLANISSHKFKLLLLISSCHLHCDCMLYYFIYWFFCLMNDSKAWRSTFNAFFIFGATCTTIEFERKIATFTFFPSLKKWKAERWKWSRKKGQQFRINPRNSNLYFLYCAGVFAPFCQFIVKQMKRKHEILYGYRR